VVKSIEFVSQLFDYKMVEKNNKPINSSSFLDAVKEAGRLLSMIS
jgi:hypothetical protein